jgi:hypothetical protein
VEVKGLPFQLRIFNVNYKSAIDTAGGPGNDCLNGYLVVESGTIQIEDQEMMRRKIQVTGEDGKQYDLLPDSKACAGGNGTLQNVLETATGAGLIAGGMVGGAVLLPTPRTNVTVGGNSAMAGAEAGASASAGATGSGHYKGGRTRYR